MCWVPGKKNPYAVHLLLLIIGNIGIKKNYAAKPTKVCKYNIYMVLLLACVE